MTPKRNATVFFQKVYLNCLYRTTKIDRFAPNLTSENKKHLKNVRPIRHCEPPHAHSPGVATGTVARRLSIDVHDDNDNDNA